MMINERLSQAMYACPVCGCICQPVAFIRSNAGFGFRSGMRSEECGHEWPLTTVVEKVEAAAC